MRLYLVTGPGTDRRDWKDELCFQDSDGDYESIGAHASGEYVAAENSLNVVEVCTAAELREALLAIYAPKEK